MRDMKLILFDVDGTLIDSQAIIHETMRLTFERFDYTAPDIETTRTIIGLTLDRAIAHLLGRDIDGEISEMVREYKSIYMQIAPREDMQSVAFSGIPNLIEELASRPEYLLGVVTGKSRSGVQKLFSTNGFGSHFVISRCADDCPSKPHPAMVLECCKELGVLPKDTLVIGDTSFDMEMAKNAGANSIGVNWGYHPKNKLELAGATRTVESSFELKNAIRHWATEEPLVNSVMSPMLMAGALLGPYYA